ncbi:hypothetical protein J3R30DRAFT_3693991 [Lentinula aciculospora]|uniref:Transcription factor domain-containing protein n=1 Tax=Lentinula aciculospora TaxID=153920 RepID=A0A9W9AW40_9AGAR|nr:hypothetical protein J3R30DRAFT_3693991 [Lentinula aciculospora]
MICRRPRLFAATGRKSGISQTWEQLVHFTDVQPIPQPSPSTTTAITIASTTETESQPFTVNSASTTPTSAPLDFKALPQSIWKYRRVALGHWMYCGTDNDEDHYDWSAPMSAVHQMSAQHQAQIHNGLLVTSQIEAQAPVETLENILEQSQIQEHLRIFHESFSPWLGFSPNHSDSFPLLSLVCCTIASRKLSSSFLVADRLLRATEHAIFQVILRPPPTYVLESIQALILIAMWAPFCSSNEPEDGWRDPHLLLSSAVSLATKIKLNEAPERYSTLRKMCEQGLKVDSVQLRGAADSARLWISLTNAESILCVGTHRAPFSRRDEAYLQCFPRYPSNLGLSALGDSAEASDARLRLLAETLSATEEGLSLRLNSIEEFESWHYAMTDVLQRIDSCTRLLLPFRVVLDLDQTLIFRAQTIVTRCYRLLVFENPVAVARKLSIHYGPGILKSQSYSNVFAEVFTPWGKDALQISEEIFVSLQELLENLDRDADHIHDHFLASAPDHFFHMIQLAGVFLISFKFMVYNAQKCVLPGSSDLLFQKIIEHLRLLQVPRVHPAKKCADLLGGLLELWTTREILFSSPPQQATLEPSGDSYRGHRAKVHETKGERDPKGSTSSSSSANSPDNATSIASPISEQTFSPSSLGSREMFSFTMFAQDATMPQPGLDLNAVSTASMPVFPSATVGGTIDNPVYDGWPDIFQDVQFWQNLFMQQPVSE